MAKVRINADAFARLIEAIADRPRSYKAIAEETGLHYTTVRDYVNALHKRQQVHIAGYGADARGYNTIPLFGRGFGIDAKPAAMSSAERKRKQRTKEYAAAGKPPPKVRLPKRAVNSVFALGEKVK